MKSNIPVKSVFQNCIVVALPFNLQTPTLFWNIPPGLCNPKHLAMPSIWTLPCCCHEMVPHRLPFPNPPFRTLQNDHFHLFDLLRHIVISAHCTEHVIVESDTFIDFNGNVKDAHSSDLVQPLIEFEAVAWRARFEKCWRWVACVARAAARKTRHLSIKDGAISKIECVDLIGRVDMWFVVSSLYCCKVWRLWWEKRWGMYVVC